MSCRCQASLFLLLILSPLCMLLQVANFSSMEESTTEFEGKPIREWDDIIPEEQRRKIEEEEKQREMEDIFMLPRSRSSNKRVRGEFIWERKNVVGPEIEDFKVLPVFQQLLSIWVGSFLSFRLRPMTAIAMWAPSWSTAPLAPRARLMIATTTRNQRRGADPEPAKTTWRVSLMQRYAGKAFSELYFLLFLCVFWKFPFMNTIKMFS